MAKARSVILGVGCLVLVIGVVLVALVVRGLSKPGLPSDVVLAINLAGPIAEVTAEDPFAEMFGDQPMSLSDLRRALNRAAEDDRVEGVRLRIGSLRRRIRRRPGAPGSAPGGPGRRQVDIGLSRDCG